MLIVNAKKIAYVTTEFPGQTHIFLWREYCELISMGVDVQLVSTRLPHKNIDSHSWSEAAKEKTEYMLPLKLSSYFGILISFFNLRWFGLKRIFYIFSSTDDRSVKHYMNLLASLVMAAHLVSLAKRHRWSHIHSTTSGNAANIAMFASCFIDITYSISLLGPKLETYGVNQKNKWRYASFGLFQSMQLLDDANSQLGTCVPKLHAFAPVGVNVDVMKVDTPYVPWSDEMGVCRLYSCGRLNPIKGHEYVIEAVKILRERGRNIHLKIAGEDIGGGTGYRKNIEQCIRDLKQERYVELLGAVSEDQNRAYLACTHIYVMGSLDEAAGAVAAMEAMSMNRPVVMPNVGATSELIDNDHDGVLVEVKNALALADAVESLMMAPERARLLGIHAREKIEKKFNQKISARAIAKFLEAI